MTSPLHYSLTPNGPLSVVDSKSASAFPSTSSSCIGSPIMVLDDDARAVAEFQFDFRLGEGSYGTVWAATHLLLISALAYCRKQGVVHRDLKAENLLLDRHGNLLVCDFGFSLKLLPVPHEDNDDESDEQQFSCVPLGTIHYASPEAAAMVGDSKALDGFEQDLWAASVILYFMVSGKLPFDGRDEEETLYLIRKCRPSIDYLPISEDGKDLLRHLLVQDPIERFNMHDVLSHRWFGKELDATLFPEDEDSSESASEASSNAIGRSLRSNENLLIRRHSSRIFLDFSQSPQEPVSPTQEEEAVIRRAFKAIGTNGYDDCFTFDELRDALILLKKCTVDCEEVMSLISMINVSGNKDIVTFEEFRNAWIEKDLAHAKHQDCQFFQLFKLASISHTECEAHIVRQLRTAFDSVDEMHTGIISFPQWKRIFERAHIDVTDAELHGLLQFWNEVIPDGSEAISFEDFVAGIVKRDILLKHPLGKKLANATNLSGFAQLRHVDQSVRTGFLVLGLRESIADKLIVQSERLHMINRSQRSMPNEMVISFWYRKEGQPQSCCHTSPPMNITAAPDSPSLLRKKMSVSGGLISPPLSGTYVTVSPSSNVGNSPSKGGGGHCAICGCQLDVILAPTACIGYTLVKIRRISGTTADFHDCVQYISSNLDREREQATFDCAATGDSELM
ncbi:protein kinase, putative [Bodo saltans]|uniref:Protein kinase, putative n=1 Tax=Bodo saltans TaxID=75058 RepID=A0A0S4IPB3_BODSA|nr:protein kinase, putative [Bodo saltans]|eukprot:CUF04177.1 protein kinase, putative [Bodo saltans]